MNRRTGAMRRRDYWPKLVAAVSVLLVPAVAWAQSAGARDSGRVYRFQLRRGDTNYVQSVRVTRQQLEERLDSLRREFEGLGLDAPDRRDLSRELRMIISSLSELTQLEQNVRTRVAPLRSKVEALAESEVFAGPFRRSAASLQPGWIGINAEAPHTRMIVRNDSAYIRYFGYPEIVSVEPNSPAERAGIARGDQLVAYDGADLRDREINLTRLLRPSRRLMVTVRRDGEERQFPLVVTKPPPQVMARRQLSLPEAADTLAEPLIVLRAPLAPRALAARGVVVFDAMDAEKAPLAGARLTEIRSEELGHIFGVSNGVLVTEVFSDPARSSGLHGGDVIVGAEGQDITSVTQLRRIVAGHTSDRAVELEIVRQKKTRSIMLRW